ncbi:DsbA family protein [Sphingomonas jinjuensis]|uniref:DsbA family protein n=1 Tax=Sphingomonas jinjuensis TaxID=535907 RepID=UPI0031B61E48
MAGLAVAVVGSWGVAQLLRRTEPIGRDVGAAADAILADRGSPEEGPEDADLRVAVFSDYRCPACRRAFPALLDAVGADGKVRLIHKDWPIFGPASERAARVALSFDEQGLYAAVHRRLMADARAFDTAALRDVVESVGGDWPRAMAWLEHHDAAVTARLAANGRQAYLIGLSGTPGYLADHLAVLGALDAGEFRQLFDRARTQASPR